ncbi:MAG TPA: hypothetical protein VFH80_33370 [Solirubrobacteraceae bacterium]|nr:hypothetical protein [Solirubrobacteraceae bacterium]
MSQRGSVKFSERPLASRVGIVLLGTIQVTLLVAAQLDIQRRPAEQINGPKMRWRLLCLINIIGPLSYFRWGRRSQDRAGA